MGGSVVEPMRQSLLHNHATFWSNLQDCKISSTAEIPRCGKNQKNQNTTLVKIKNQEVNYFQFFYQGSMEYYISTLGGSEGNACIAFVVREGWGSEAKCLYSLCKGSKFLFT